MEEKVVPSREFLDLIFNYVPAGKNLLGDPYDEYWWTTAQDGEGYYMIWSNGDTFHTYRRPDEIHS